MFSPNSVAKDEAIMTAVIERLHNRRYEVVAVSEEDCPLTDIQPSAFDIVLSMGRHPETLRWVASLDVLAVNSPQGVAHCHRRMLEQLMRDNKIPIPPQTGTKGYWLKRGDGAAQTKDDVVFAADEEEMMCKINDFRQRGIDYTVSAHVVGDVVKFYGVCNSGFFRYYYPTDDGESKFGDEQRNGMARHYPFEVEALQNCVEQLAKAVGTKVYGGDCIVDEKGKYYIIDFNDWPSFSRCREDASDAIASLIMNYELLITN